MKENERLTEQERTFAEQHHGLIYKFLSEEHLQESEFYDIVARGYLRAVRRWHREEKCRQYKFSTIAWSAMRCCVGNKRRADRIRNAMIAYSVNELTEDGTEYGEFIQNSRDAFWELEQEENLQELLKRIMPALTEQQQDHIVAALEGYKQQEIIHRQRVSIQRYHANRRAIQAATSEALSLFPVGGVLLEIWIGTQLLRLWQALIYKTKNGGITR